MIYDPHTSFVHLLLRAIALALVAGICAVLGSQKAEPKLAEVRVQPPRRDGR